MSIAADPGAQLRLDLTEPVIAPLVPVDRREDIAVLWALDRRLGEIARAGREPALRQIKLRWWSDQLGRLDDGHPPAEPLLMQVQALTSRVAATDLVALADAWEAEAVEDGAAVERGAVLFALTAKLLGAAAIGTGDGGRLWAMVERGIVGACDAPYWEEPARAARGADVRGMPRSLAALTSLARTIALRGGVRSRWREQAAVLRAGLIGR